MYRLALLSFHGCPVARLGEKDTGGMNVYVMQLAKEFGRRGHQVDVFTRYHDPLDPQIVELGEGARVVHLKAGPYDTTKQDLYQFIPEFLTALDSFRSEQGIDYDLIHSHYWLSGSIGMALSEDWDVPHVATFHTLAKTKLRARAGEQESEVRVNIERTVMQRADGLVVSTEMEKDDLVKLYQASRCRIKVVPAGVDLELFYPRGKDDAKQKLGIQENRVILYVGRIEPLKGIDILLKAVALLEDPADTRLVIVGGSLEDDLELERLKGLSETLGIQEKVTFTGSVPQGILPDFYSAADVFVLPSYYESFGLVALEAMACGTPVVVSRVGGLKTFIKQGETGYLIPWRCPEPFAQRLDILMANPDLKESMGKAARAQALEMSWSGVADRLLDFYSDLLAESWVSVAGA
ncbi:MAG: glycosyltransferase [Chloroflexi bacterium]|nr:glycosyltransferase [Chloroflexota bacterium]MCI0790454.1 glycosyltransferase [Chloroflexota bacterium]MCI0796201.1 glycosyltransferase [Chloroflexota bacterium]MCI0812559.1 glycosyltransferase [Chloroflexota bacterium]MCI0821957.1 glycosyltransferase [Chloroflexota bacterium]